ncbi:secondary thiamine-phosphate synthase enzyme YjbQ [Ammoniphilus sp. YIM 78166]|uniref:secondary thiamine-phosphate synthase enzyme YjbQ n=1 Tax=Ammoniphilus sp. YIM 78166 TaxID=1644106 RepID=UPI001070604D|nr:secondary thiamine-phosphate synthase enzyme YjbQ [Ammoniphilus sp. YIM 78166]
MLHTLQLQTKKSDEMIDITSKVKTLVEQEQVREGAVLIYCPHTTAGITINENADPDVVRDMLMRWGEVYPWEHPRYRHGEGNSASHLKASTVGASQHVIISNGKLLLGTWQGIYFCEFDGPRNRTCYVKVLK